MELPVIYGWNKSSEAGPDNFSPSIFLGGCNFKCPYCMNAKLVKFDSSLKEIDLEEVKDFVIENKCPWVNISGGEPSCNRKLIQLIKHIKRWGCNVALSTNGYNYKALNSIFPFVGYVTLDYKTTPNKYEDLVVSYNGKRNESVFLQFMATLTLIRNLKLKGKLDYEIRTTLYKPLIEYDIDEMAKYVLKNEKWILQPFRPTKCMLSENAYLIKPYSKEDLSMMKQTAERYCDNVKMRDV